jgi:hypothetical protein
MTHSYSPSPRQLAVPGIGFPQNISVGSDVIDRWLSPREPDSEPMVESIAVEFRAQAARYDALAKQADCAARESLYRRLARGYLTLADLAHPPEAMSGKDTSELLKDLPTGQR